MTRPRRWRLVSTQAGRTHVSSVILNEEEAHEAIRVEADLHRLAGWDVTEGDRVVVCRRGRLSRTVEARAYDAFTDAVNARPPLARYMLAAYRAWLRRNPSQLRLPL